MAGNNNSKDNDNPSLSQKSNCIKEMMISSFLRAVISTPRC